MPITAVGKKISVIGPPGSGKSTLSIRLGKILGIDVHHLDRLWWLPDWKESSTEEFDRKLGLLLSNSSWIIDGNYQRTIERRIQSSDTVIWLDFGRTVCLYRVLKRILKFKLGERREDMTEGCDERLDMEFMKWIWNYRKREWYFTKDLVQEYGNGRDIIILRNPREASRFLKSLFQRAD